MNNLLKYSKDRSLLVNIVFCILSFLGMLIFASVIQLILQHYINNTILCSLLANIVLIIFLFVLYYKDLIKEAKTYKSSFKKIFSKSFKIYLIGFMGMIFFNAIISIFLKNISSNEEQVREMLFNNTLISMMSISIIAPISEELIFRKSLDPIFKNKWVYVIISGFLFGFAHILTNLLSGSFILTDLFYILPYGALGSSFAYMDRENKTVFSSIVIHSLHNTFTALLLLAFYKGGLI